MHSMMGPIDAVFALLVGGLAYLQYVQHGETGKGFVVLEKPRTASEVYCKVDPCPAPPPCALCEVAAGSPSRVRFAGGAAATVGVDGRVVEARSAL